MKLIDLVNFFKSPPDREVIRRWTVPPDEAAYRLDLPQPSDPERFCFLALGDSGDSAGTRVKVTPQDAVARFMAEEAALPGSGGKGHFVLHTGDVVYMTGERRLYDRNFRRPYSDFLTPESTVDNLVFRIPYLPVPGNHDYYDFSGFAALFTRMPLIGAGLAAVARELFTFQVPLGGSDMGAAYMHAFVDGKAGPAYEPGKRTRVPNRYYKFRYGSVDFFALDSNTLEAPPPDHDLAAERDEAARKVKDLEKQAASLGKQIKRDEEAVERWLECERERLAADPERVRGLAEANEAVTEALGRLAQVLESIEATVAPCGDARKDAEALRELWAEQTRRIESRRGVPEALETLDGADDRCCVLLESLENCMAELPAGPEREALLAAQEGVALAARHWRVRGTGGPPGDLCIGLQKLTASVLDVHRNLALERRRMDRQPDDYDSAQLEWLRASIEESVRENPDGWRVVFLHQPLYSTIGDHAENHDVVGVRENLTPLVRDHVHLVLAGHAHAFEWFQSTQLPTTGLIVTGGGGQPWLWRSILDPKKFNQFRHLYQSLRQSGATECVAAGNGPPAPDGEEGALYHYVRIEVTPDVLRVIPVGVRKAKGEYRREEPMPAWHVPEFPRDPQERPPWNRRQLRSVEIRRGAAPRAVWQ